MKKILILLTLTFTINLYPRIPVESEKLRITSTFGEFRGDHFHNGVDFGGNKMKIYPMFDGEIVYYFDEAEDPTKQIFGSGNLMVIEHKDRVRSYYYHIEPNTIEKNHSQVTEKDVIALTGNSGRSGGAHLHLTIEDLKEGIVVDPLSYLNIKKDSEQSPMIWGIYLRTENQLIQIKDKMTIRYNGEVRLFVKAYDLLGAIPMGLKRVKIYIDDEIIRDYDFTYFIKKDGIYQLNPDYKFEDIYGVDSHFYRGGTFTPRRKTYKFTAVITNFDDKTITLTRTVTFR